MAVPVLGVRAQPSASSDCERKDRSLCTDGCQAPEGARPIRLITKAIVPLGSGYCYPTLERSRDPTLGCCLMSQGSLDSNPELPLTSKLSTGAQETGRAPAIAVCSQASQSSWLSRSPHLSIG